MYHAYDIINIPIGCDGKIERAYLSNAKSNINLLSWIYSDDSSYRFIGEQKLSIQCGGAKVFNSKNELIKTLNRKKNLTLFKTSYKDIINAIEAGKRQFFESYVYI